MGYNVQGRRVNANLSDDEVRLCRRLHREGKATPRQLADRFNMAAESMRKCLRWETYGWVSENGPEPVQRAEPTEAEIQASKDRFFGKLQAEGLMPAEASKPQLSAEEFQKQQWERELREQEATAARVAETAARHAHPTRGDHLLGELDCKPPAPVLDSAIGGGVPPGTDGGVK